MAHYSQVVPSSGDAQTRLVQIQKKHLDYLHSDDGSDKQTISRQFLEDLIVDHLSTVAHKEKFTCSYFLDILRKSVDECDDFDAGRAAVAFLALEQYACNLIMQPWRQEYWTVRLYSGFYKHKIEAPLSNAVEVFFLMGYELADRMELRLNEPVDPDRVIDIALNCLIAAIECKIMVQVLEKAMGCATWKDIARQRRRHVGTAEQTSHALRDGGGGGLDNGHKATKSTYMNKLTDIGGGGRCRRHNNGYVKVEKLVDVPGMWSEVGSGGTADATMEADKQYPATKYGLSWELKKQSAANSHNGSAFSSLADVDNDVSLMSTRHNNLQKQQQRRLAPLEDSWSVERLGRRSRDFPVGQEDHRLVRKTSVPDARIPPVYDNGIYSGSSSLGVPPPPTPPKRLNACRAGDPYHLIFQQQQQQVPAVSMRTLGVGGAFVPSGGGGCDPRLFQTPFDLSDLDQLLYDDLLPWQDVKGFLPHHRQHHYHPAPPNISRDHVCRADVAYSSAPAPLIHPTYAKVLAMSPTSQPRLVPQQLEGFKSFSLDGDVPVRSRNNINNNNNNNVVVVNQKMKKPAPEARRSFYDNVPNDDDQMIVSSTDSSSIVRHQLEMDGGGRQLLPPPKPFASDGVVVVGDDDCLPPFSARPSSRHRRRSSDGVREVRATLPAAPLEPHVVVVKEKLLPPEVSASAEKLGRKYHGNATSNELRECLGQMGVTRDSVERNCPSSASSSATNSSSSSSAAVAATTTTTTTTNNNYPRMLRHERSASVSSSSRSRSASSSSATSALGGGTTNNNHRGVSGGKTWNCWACTFLNGADRDVCDICAHSRHKGAESDPLSSGGHECQKCTLVNAKGTSKCVACDNNLENSPTYV